MRAPRVPQPFATNGPTGRTHDHANPVPGVDAENPSGALRLYESVGLTVVETSYTYHKDL